LNIKVYDRGAKKMIQPHRVHLLLANRSFRARKNQGFRLLF